MTPEQQKKMDLYVWRYVAIVSCIICCFIIAYCIDNVVHKRQMIAESVVIALITLLGTIAVPFIVKGVFGREG